MQLSTGFFSARWLCTLLACTLFFFINSGFYWKMLVKTFSAAVCVLIIQSEMLLHLAWACDLPWMLSAAPLKLLELSEAPTAWLLIEAHACMLWRAHMLLSSTT